MCTASSSLPLTFSLLMRWFEQPCVSLSLSFLQNPSSSSSLF
ncbi:MAG: hypothetical protein Q8P67_13270 [archaeon]|nr:hypothetical protein [archaeon]